MDEVATVWSFGFDDVCGFDGFGDHQSASWGRHPVYIHELRNPIRCARPGWWLGTCEAPARVSGLPCLAAGRHVGSAGQRCHGPHSPGIRAGNDLNGRGRPSCGAGLRRAGHVTPDGRPHDWTRQATDRIIAPPSHKRVQVVPEERLRWTPPAVQFRGGIIGWVGQHQEQG